MAILASENLLADGNMEKVGVVDWDVLNAAVLTKETTNPKRGTNVIRIAWASGTNSGAGQVILEVGKTYRVTGWARGDGVTDGALPRIRLGSTSPFTGTNSNTWQHIDFIGVSDTADFKLYSNLVEAGYVEFDDIRAEEYKGTPTGGVNLVADGNMEKVGTTDWASANNGVITKETTNPHRGSQVLRVTGGGTANGAARASILTIGNLYRATGWCRGDGTANPRVGIGTSVQFSGTSSTDWQWFDITATSAGTGLLLYNEQTTGYSEFDDIKAEEYKGKPTGGVNLVADGNMEKVGVVDWTPINCTLTKETTNPHRGSQLLRLTKTGAATGTAYQTVITIGKTYRFTGWARGDGGGLTEPRISDGVTFPWTGTNSTEWQYFDEVFVAATVNPFLQVINGGAGEYCEFDDVRVEEVD